MDQEIHTAKLLLKKKNRDYLHQSNSEDKQKLSKLKKKCYNIYNMANIIPKVRTVQICAPSSNFSCRLAKAKSWNVNWDLITTNGPEVIEMPHVTSHLSQIVKGPVMVRFKLRLKSNIFIAK